MHISSLLTSSLKPQASSFSTLLYLYFVPVCSVWSILLCWALSAKTFYHSQVLVSILHSSILQLPKYLVPDASLLFLFFLSKSPKTFRIDTYPQNHHLSQFSNYSVHFFPVAKRGISLQSMSQISPQPQGPHRTSLPIAKFSHNSCQVGVRNFVWNHVGVRNDMEFVVQNTKAVDDFGNYVNRIVMKVTAGAETLVCIENTCRMHPDIVSGISRSWGVS